MNRFIILFVLGFHTASGQVPIDWLSNFKKLETVTNGQFWIIGQDTITKDSFAFSFTEFRRISKNGLVVAELIEDECADYKLCYHKPYQQSGTWIKKHRSGEISERGKYICGNKVGEWFYFYKDGQLRKYENFRTVPFLDEMRKTFRSGPYKEYFENGKIRLSGEYKLILVNDLYIEPVDWETYESRWRCCEWLLDSRKYGKWRYYDENGNLISEEDYTFDIVADENLKELTDLIHTKHFGE